jgi:hypothetical protein
MIKLTEHHLTVLVGVESFVGEFLFVDDRLSMDDSVPSAVSALIAIHQVIVRRRTIWPLHYSKTKDCNMITTILSFSVACLVLCLSDLTGLFVHARAHHDLGTTGHTVITLVITQQSTGQRSTFNDNPHVCDLWESRRNHGARGCSPALYRGTCRRSSHFFESRGIFVLLEVCAQVLLTYCKVLLRLDYRIHKDRVQKFPLAQYALLNDRSAADYDISSLRICHSCAKDGMRLYILLTTTNLKPHVNPNERESLAMARNQIRLKQSL